MTLPLTAGRGVTQVIERCENAKESAFLDLSNCSLMYIADAIYLVLKGYAVTKVDLRANSLKKFPKKMVEKFPGLTIMNCEGNNIEEIPDELKNWTCMRGFNASHNQLATFPSTPVQAMSALLLLDLSHNQIQELDVDDLYTNCPKLVQLNLEGNPLKEDVKKHLMESNKKPPNLTIKL